MAGFYSGVQICWHFIGYNHCHALSVFNTFKSSKGACLLKLDKMMDSDFLIT